MPWRRCTAAVCRRWRGRESPRRTCRAVGRLKGWCGRSTRASIAPNPRGQARCGERTGAATARDRIPAEVAKKSRSGAARTRGSRFTSGTGLPPTTRSREEAGRQRRPPRAASGSAERHRCNRSARGGAAPKGLERSHQPRRPKARVPQDCLSEQRKPRYLPRPRTWRRWRRRHRRALQAARGQTREGGGGAQGEVCGKRRTSYS